MSGPRPSKCQNCGYSTRYSRQKPGEMPIYCVNHQAWLCSGCRELRGCAKAKHRVDSAPVRTDFQNVVPPNDGIYGKILDTVYHADLESLSSSGARALLSMTPEEFDHQRREPAKPKKHFDFGHAAHKMVLGEGAEMAVLDPNVHGRKADGSVADKPSATAKWKAAEAAFREQGKTVITKAQMDEAQRMAGKVFEHSDAGRIFGTEGDAEHSIYWHDDATGIRRRIRPDCLITEGVRRPVCVDYKSAKSVTRKSFQRSVVDYGYYMQQPYYEDGLAELGIENVLFLFVVQSVNPPYTVALYPLEPEIVDLGRRQNRRALELFARCKAENHWPGYDGIQQPIGMSGWAMKEIEEMLQSA